MNTEALFSFIDGSRELVIELQREMCARPAISPVSGGEGELQKALYIEDFLRNHGVTALERFDAPDPAARGGVRPNVIATIPGKTDAGRIWVISHLDVVPPGDLAAWPHNPWELAVDGDDLSGRGVEDNQQGICSSILAALSFVKQGVTPPQTVKLLFAADEETGSAFGLGYLMEQHPALFKKDDMALVPDSGNSEGNEIEIAEKNLLWLKITIEGRQAHGSRPDLGINAHLAQADLALALHEGLARRFSAQDGLFDPPYSSFEPTRIEANVPNVNTIPGKAVFYLDARVLPRYPLKDALAACGEIAREVEQRRNVRIEFAAEQAQESPATPVESPLFQRLSRSIERTLGVSTRPIGIGGGTVAAYLRRAGVDSAVWSKLDENAHKIGEKARISNILAEAKVTAGFFAAQ